MPALLSPFERQPPELLLCLVPFLNLEDYMSLGCTSKRFRRVLEDEGMFEIIGNVRSSLSPARHVLMRILATSQILSRNSACQGGSRQILQSSTTCFFQEASPGLGKALFSGHPWLWYLVLL